MTGGSNGKTKIETEIIITPAEYAEYQHLRSLYRLETKLESVRRLKSLEQDIDAPIRPVVAMLALLGCEPIWSCCGFDYAEQPVHKSHEYGTVGIAIKDNEAIRRVGGLLLQAHNIAFQEKRNCWRLRGGLHYGDRIIYLMSGIEDGNLWPDRDSIHYSEPGAIAIGLLKRFLFSLKDTFLEQAVLGDFNAVYKSRYPDWQYPPLTDWVINRADVIDEVEKELG